MMHSISVAELPFFSNLVKDYLKENQKTKKLYSFSPCIDGLKEALESKEKTYTQRDVLNIVLDNNYLNDYIPSDKEKEHLALLRHNGFAITTAHQPNLFLGPLYTITKAVSAIALANKLNEELGETRVVPIFVIGSEDHDKEELLHAYLFGNKYEWITNQQGSIGSMTIDDSFNSLLDEWVNGFGNMPYAEELTKLFQACYHQGNTIAESFGLFLKQLFGRHGLIVLDLNQKEVKNAMVPIFKKELEENYSMNSLKSNLEYLKSEYFVQAEPRAINLFEYRNGERRRIDQADQALIEKLHIHPENFSPNVILRPLMQQTVLPSIANIGGGAEVGYWLQLKPIFDAALIDFPVIILRDIFSPLDKKSFDKWTENKLNLEDFFLHTDAFRKKIVLQDSSLESDFKKIENATIGSFEAIENKLVEIDKSLAGSYQAELVKLQKSIETLYSKAVKAEKKKAEDLINSLEKIKNKVFEDNYLIERKENFSAYYLKGGQDWVEAMIANANPLDAEWKLNLV